VPQGFQGFLYYRLVAAYCCLLIRVYLFCGEEYKVQMQKSEMIEFAELVAQSVVKALGGKSANPKVEKTAYQRCEQLLYNYNNFKKILEDRKKEIEELRKYGVPGRSAGFEYNPHSNVPHGIVLEEERVEAAVRTVQESVQGIVDAITLIDKCMAMLKNDPYYAILPMRYFEDRTLEDIGVEFGKDTATISRNRVRLVKELSMRLFPDQYIHELMNL
jgi:hypothetical protein